MIIQVRHEFDGKNVRARFLSSVNEDNVYALMGMLAMSKDEFLMLRLALLAGSTKTGLKVLIEEDELINEKKDGEIRMPR